MEVITTVLYKISLTLLQVLKPYQHVTPPETLSKATHRIIITPNISLQYLGVISSESVSQLQFSLL